MSDPATLGPAPSTDYQPVEEFNGLRHRMEAMTNNDVSRYLRAVRSFALHLARLKNATRAFFNRLLAPTWGRFAVTTMDVPWRVTKNRLGAEPLDVVLVESMEIDVLEQQLAALRPCDTIVGIGGGQAVDLAKCFAWRRGIRLVSIPTVLSVDAFVTPAARVRRKHQVEYVRAASPDPLVISSNA